MALIQPSDEQQLEIQAGKIARQVFVTSKNTPAEILETILLCAMANWNVVAPFYKAQLAYAEDEDLDVVELWMKKATQLGKRTKARG